MTELTMKTAGTAHLSTSEFSQALANSSVGEITVYAIGDIGYSCDRTNYWDELKGIRRVAWEAHKRKEITLTQRRREDLPFPTGGGASFEYRATKRRKPFYDRERA